MKTIYNSSAMSVAHELAAAFAGRLEAADRSGKLPPADIEALRQSRYLGIVIPERYGGLGLSLKECAAAQVALAKGSPSTAIVAAMTIQIFGHAREVCLWPEATFSRFCRAIVGEGALFNSVASEPELGSPSRGQIFQTTAKRAADGDGWLLNGHKTWATGGRHLTHLLVRADIEGEPGVVLVRGEADGVRWEETWQNALSLRASASHDVYFEAVRVPDEQIVERGQHSPPPSIWFPMIMGSVYLGAALGARDSVIRYAQERVPSALGRPIATLPAIQREIGAIELALEAARAFFFEVAGEWQGEEEKRERMLVRAGAAKTLAVETACEVTERALRIAGGRAIAGASALEIYFRDVRAGLAQPPSRETALETIGKAALEAAGD